MSRVTILGLGAMGSRMAVNLISAGHQLTVWNRNPEKAKPLSALGAIFAATPREAVTDAEFVISIVSDDEASNYVWLDPETGALDHVPVGAIAIESSTLTTSWVQALGEAALSAGVGFLDACVSGSRPQVENRQLIYFVGGPAEVLELAKPIFEGAGGATIHHAGAVGAGSAIKLATNVLLGVQTVAMAEALSLLRREGIEPLHAIDMIGSTFVCSTFAKGVGTLMAKGMYGTMFATELVAKDMRYALIAGHGAKLPLISATHDVFEDAIKHGFGAENLTSVAKLYPEHPHADGSLDLFLSRQQ